MDVKTFNNYLDYIKSDINNWSYVTLDDLKKSQNKKVKVYFDKQDNEIDVVLINKKTNAYKDPSMTMERLMDLFLIIILSVQLLGVTNER
jgi:hypothetical protein